MVVIRRLCKQLKTAKLEGYTLYCTLQPCGMCTMACLWAGVSRIVTVSEEAIKEAMRVYFSATHQVAEGAAAAPLAAEARLWAVLASLSASLTPCTPRARKSSQPTERLC